MNIIKYLIKTTRNLINPHMNITKLDYYQMKNFYSNFFLNFNHNLNKKLLRNINLVYYNRKKVLVQ
jgi:hypothetical protein